jgi:hypothetical protein
MIAQPVFQRRMAEPELHVSGIIGLGASLISVLEVSQLVRWSQSVRIRKVVENESLATDHVGLPVPVEYIALAGDRVSHLSRRKETSVPRAVIMSPL